MGATSYESKAAGSYCAPTAGVAEGAALPRCDAEKTASCPTCTVSCYQTPTACR